jgi:hypothetical protein
VPKASSAEPTAGEVPSTARCTPLVLASEPSKSPRCGTFAVGLRPRGSLGSVSSSRAFSRARSESRGGRRGRFVQDPLLGHHRSTLGASSVPRSVAPRSYRYAGPLLLRLRRVDSLGTVRGSPAPTRGCHRTVGIPRGRPGAGLYRTRLPEGAVIGVFGGPYWRPEICRCAGEGGGAADCPFGRRWRGFCLAIGARIAADAGGTWGRHAFSFGGGWHGFYLLKTNSRALPGEIIELPPRRGTRLEQSQRWARCWWRAPNSRRVLVTGRVGSARSVGSLV